MHKIVLLDKPRENPGELDWSPAVHFMRVASPLSVVRDEAISAVKPRVALVPDPGSALSDTSSFEHPANAIAAAATSIRVFCIFLMISRCLAVIRTLRRAFRPTRSLPS